MNQLAKIQKKKEAKAKKKIGAAIEPVSKPSTSRKRKDREVDDENNDEVEAKRNKVCSNYSFFQVFSLLFTLI